LKPDLLKWCIIKGLITCGFLELSTINILCHSSTLVAAIVIIVIIVMLIWSEALRLSA
jgi:hypothetical protein